MSGRIYVRKIILTALCALLLPTAEAAANEALASKSGCLGCHSVDKKIIGPAFRDVAERYRGDARAAEALREKIKNGGKGNWTEVTGGVLMPPHSALLSDSEVRSLVDWILSR